MEQNKNYFIWLILTMIIIIISVSAYKAYKLHEEKLYYVVHQKIKEAALACYIEKKCVDKITLQDLYDQEYLKNKVIDPVKKEELDENLCLNYINGVVDFC